MAEPFLSEIRIMSFSFAPKGWAQCNGALVPIAQNQPLFAVLGTTFGGDGKTTFALPDCRTRVPIHVGKPHVLGELGGEQNHTLTISETPQHIHFARASSTAGNAAPVANNILANSPALIYGAAANLTALQPGTVGNAGGSLPHNNLQP